MIIGYYVDYQTFRFRCGFDYSITLKTDFLQKTTFTMYILFSIKDREECFFFLFICIEITKTLEVLRNASLRDPKPLLRENLDSK